MLFISRRRLEPDLPCRRFRELAVADHDWPIRDAAEQPVRVERRRVLDFEERHNANGEPGAKFYGGLRGFTGNLDGSLRRHDRFRMGAARNLDGGCGASGAYGPAETEESRRLLEAEREALGIDAELLSLTASSVGR